MSLRSPQIMKMEGEGFLTSVRNDNNGPRLSFRPKGEIFLCLCFRKSHGKEYFVRQASISRYSKHLSLSDFTGFNNPSGKPSKGSKGGAMKPTTNLKRPWPLAAVLGLAAAILVLPGTAWSGLRDDLREFDRFLRERPRVAADLTANPDLVNSRRYLDRHEDLAKFIRNRPALRQELHYNPRRVIARSSAYDRYDRYDRYGRAGWRR